MDQLLKETIHQCYSSFYFLILARFLSSDNSLPSRHIHVLLGLIICLLSVSYQHLCHMVYDHANPFSIHDFETADLLKASITLLEGLEYLISIAGALPATLLVQEARMLQEIDAPVQKCLPFSLFQGDAIFV